MGWFRTYSWYKRVKVWLLLVGFGLLYLIYHQLTVMEDFSPVTSYTGVRILSGKQYTQKLKWRVLYWLPFMESYDVGKGQSNCLRDVGCDVECEVISDNTQIDRADAVNFHLSDLWPEVWKIGTKKTIEFPKYRRSDQVWIVSNMEPPLHLWGDLKVFNGLFNWTMWYRRDSTIPWIYGEPIRLNETETKKARSEIQRRNFHKEKSKLIIGVISNCHDRGRRYKIIQEMTKYIDINMFGGCYGRSCDGDNETCDDVIKKHRFYLAFENAHCKDYVTEKYWRTLALEVIPVVNWKGIDEKIVIPHSYINVYDFPDVKALTDYLHKVNNDENLYNSYFEWRKKYKTHGNVCEACKICRMLREKSDRPQVVQDLDGWVKNDHCEKIWIWTNIRDVFNSWKFQFLGI